MLKRAFELHPDLPAHIDQAGLTGVMGLNVLYNLVTLTSGQPYAEQLRSHAAAYAPQVVKAAKEELENLLGDCQIEAVAFYYQYLVVEMLIQTKLDAEDSLADRPDLQ